MRPWFSFMLLLTFLLFTTALRAQDNFELLARQAVSNDQKRSAVAVSQLRKLGPAGLEALFITHADAIQQQITEPLTASTAEWQRLSAALDAVGQQKNSYLSGIYWYTDLDEAKAAAKQSGKPILSLRLLGKLSEEFSCANSRFFRTILYSNAAISKKLREGFVMHWKSVRPVPHVTIDFGNGRKLRRTLTGNSIHYILDVNGRPIDALPGLYGPNAFLRELLASERVFAKLREAKYPNPGTALLNYRNKRINRLSVNWLADIERSGGKAPGELRVSRRPDGTIEAIQIGQLALVKMLTEETILSSITTGLQSLGRVTDEATWRKIAQLHTSDAELDSRSVGLIQRETQRVVSKEELKNLLTRLQQNVALDTVRNEYLMRIKLYAWMVQDRGRSDLDSFNDKVYSELFLTPSSDPWLGLFTADAYMALENGGVVR